MQETLITFETAKLAKEKGLQLGSERQYVEYHKTYKYDGDATHPESYKKGDVRLGSCSYIVNNRDGIDFSNKYYTLYEAPTQSLLQKWLREVHRTDITVITDWKQGVRVYYVGFSFVNTENKIDIWFSKDENNNKIEYSDYEEALEIALQEALKLIK